ncbi:MAG: polysaccharide biosynthesis/export family protein [Flavobacteriaceae bacterium]|nr:polysaccharide biosynthesis/export family protein [Flavobacteriaceae bacterium]
MKKIVFLICIIFIIQSCRTQQDVLYFRNINEIIQETAEVYTDPGIQTGDGLSIVVSTFNTKLSEPFNMQAAQGMGSGGTAMDPRSPLVYVVSSNGEIEMPVLGSINVLGKTRQELAADLVERISEYIEDPIVNVRYVNYRVTMLGEFNKPGVIESSTEKLNIMEAIAGSGDMNLYAIRDSVMIIRTVDGVRTHAFLNLQDANIINSEYFYLKQNDIVYAMPTKSKALDINTRPLTVALTVLGFATAIIALFR